MLFYKQPKRVLALFDFEPAEADDLELIKVSDKITKRFIFHYSSGH